MPIVDKHYTTYDNAAKLSSNFLYEKANYNICNSATTRLILPQKSYIIPLASDELLYFRLFL